MTNKIRHVSRLRMVDMLCLMLGLGFLFAGCGQAPQPAKKPVTKVETKAPATTVTPVKTPEKQVEKVGAPQPANAVASEKPSSIPEKIEDCQDLIRLYEKVAKLKSAGALSSDVSAEIDKKHKALLDKAKVFHFTDKLDLLAVDLRVIGPDKARIYFLLRPNVQLTSGYKIGVNAYVDKSHVKYLSADADVENLCELFVVWPTPPTTEWAPGEEILITKETNLKGIIPYNVFVGFYADEPPHRLGDRLDLGWYADLGEEK